jgi:O-antigen ligase
MRTLAPRATDTTIILIWITISLVAAMGILEFGVEPVAILGIVPWCAFLFHRYPLLLVLLWPTVLFLDIAILSGVDSLVVAGFWLTPMDPVYLFTAIYLMIHAITRPKEFLRALQANPFLSLFLVILIVYIVYYTPLYGKSALGEARKFYFPFFFPILALVSMKEPGSLKRVLLAVFCVAIGSSMVALLNLTRGVWAKAILNAQGNLLLLFVMFSIVVYHINSNVLIKKSIDAIILVLFISIIVITQHRSVFLAGAAGLICMSALYINRVVVFSKIVMASLVMLAVLSIIIIRTPKLEQALTKSLKGIVTPYEDDTASWRIDGWQQQLDRLVRNKMWLFGEGLGNYYWLDKSRLWGVAPHNGYLQVVMKFGLVGLCIYALLVGKFFLATLKARGKLAPGLRRAYVEMGIINFGAAHAYLIGYGIEMSMLLFVALAMMAAQLPQVSWRGPRTA